MKKFETFLFNAVMNQTRALIVFVLWVLLWGISLNMGWGSMYDITWWGWIMLVPGLVLLGLTALSFFIAFINLLIRQF